MPPSLVPSGQFVPGKNVLITGCTSGIGKLDGAFTTAALKPAKIFLACRSKDRGDALAKEVEALGVAAQVLVGDMSCRDGCNAIADAMLETGEPLHVLVSNAGLWEALRKEKMMSKDPDLETHFMTNYLSMVIIIKKLEPLLARSAESAEKPSRIVVTGSFTSITIVKGQANVDDLQFASSKITEKVPNDQTYAQSKLLQYMWAKKFAKDIISPNVALMVYCPGWLGCETNNDVYHLLKKMTKCCFPVFKCCFGTRTADIGAQIALWCCDSDEGAKCNGKCVDFGTYRGLKYYPPQELSRSIVYKCDVPSVKDDAQVEKLWNYTEGVLQKPGAV